MKLIKTLETLHFFSEIKSTSLLLQQTANAAKLSDLNLNKLLQKMFVPDISRVSLKYKWKQNFSDCIK